MRFERALIAMRKGHYVQLQNKIDIECNRFYKIEDGSLAAYENGRRANNDLPHDGREIVNGNWKIYEEIE